MSEKEISKLSSLQRIQLLLSKISTALALSSCLVAFALQKQHVTLEGKCLTQYLLPCQEEELLKT